MNPDTDSLVRIRSLALALPDAVETMSDGMPGFCIEGSDAFAHVRPESGATVVVVRTADAEEQAKLIRTDPDRYSLPSYPGEVGWIAIRMDGKDADWDLIGDRIAQSWEIAAPPHLLEAGGR